MAQNATDQLEIRKSGILLALKNKAREKNTKDEKKKLTKNPRLQISALVSRPQPMITSGTRRAYLGYCRMFPNDCAATTRNNKPSESTIIKERLTGTKVNQLNVKM